MTPKTNSFLPEDYVERRVELRTNLICLSLFGVVLMGVAGAYLMTRNERTEVLKQQEKINLQYAEAAQRLAQLEELRQQKRLLLRKAQISATLVEPVPRSNLLADLINRMPDSLSLLDLELTSKKLAAPRVAPDPKKSAMANKKKSRESQDSDEPAPPPVPKYRVTMSIVGVAPTDMQVASFMASLARSPLFSEVDLLFSEKKNMGDTPMRRFKVRTVLSNQVDVRSLEPLIQPRSKQGSVFGTMLGQFQTQPGDSVVEVPSAAVNE